jgi:TIR domain
MADVFISYSKHDPEPTERLAAELERQGYSVWWDTSLLTGGR